MNNENKRLSPEMKLSEVIKYLNTERKLSKRQIGFLSGFRNGESVTRQIIDTGNMTTKQYNQIYEELSNNIDVVHSLLIESGKKNVNL